MISWWKNRQEESFQHQFDLGFGWVMSRYWLYHDPTYYIQDTLYERNSSYAFREGGSAALDLLPDPNEEWANQQ